MSNFEHDKVMNVNTKVGKAGKKKQFDRVTLYMKREQVERMFSLLEAKTDINGVKVDIYTQEVTTDSGKTFPSSFIAISEKSERPKEGFQKRKFQATSAEIKKFKASS